jgi:hypothetical protein
LIISEFDTSTYINKNNSNNITFYPNPVDNYLTFELPLSALFKKLKLVIYDINGTKVLERSYNEINSNVIKYVFIDKLSSGTYVFNLSLDNGATNFTGKFIVSK